MSTNHGQPVYLHINQLLKLGKGTQLIPLKVNRLPIWCQVQLAGHGKTGFVKAATFVWRIASQELLFQLFQRPVCSCSKHAKKGTSRPTRPQVAPEDSRRAQGAEETPNEWAKRVRETCCLGDHIKEIHFLLCPVAREKKWWFVFFSDSPAKLPNK